MNKLGTSEDRTISANPEKRVKREAQVASQAYTVRCDAASVTGTETSIEVARPDEFGSSRRSCDRPAMTLTYFIRSA